MIHITESTALKSDSDRSLRSYYNNLKERIANADFDVKELTLKINDTLDQIDYMAEKLEGFREELLDYIEEEKTFLPEKGKTSLTSTLETIKEVLQGSDIKDIRNEIENESKCLAACQACFTATYSICSTADTPFCDYSTCNVCVSSQTGCQFCDSDQNTCVIEDAVCDYTSPCTPCYSQLYNSCRQEQVSCNYSAGCVNCQNNVSTCNNCQGNVGTCTNCYGGSYGECGAGQQTTCGERHAACTSNNEVQCSGCDSCQTNDSGCNRNVGCFILVDVSCNEGWSTCKRSDVSQTCKTKYKNGDDIYCESKYSIDDDGNYHCEQLFTGGDTECLVDFDQGNGVKDCDTGYKCGTNNDSCGSGYSTTNGETHCNTNFADTCASAYINCGTGDDIGCLSGYSDCPSCYGTSFGCNGCYDVEYCSKCDAAQTTCNTCVNGQTTCTSCVKGEEGHQEDTCGNCYMGCQSSWDAVSECFSSQSGMPSPGSCTICVTCQVVHGGVCTGCDGGCQGSDCSPGDASCGVANCGSANCGSSNCGTSNCGTGQCNQSGCSTCDDVSACVCSHTGSYGCNFPLYNG